MSLVINIPPKKLTALHCSVWGREKRLVFRYKSGRWDLFESIRPWNIREALKVGLEKIEDAFPGAVAKAAILDDKNFQSNKRRTRRYIAERRDLLYPDSPHLRSQSEFVGGHWVVTNISWPDVPAILKLVCESAPVQYGSLSGISF